MAGIFTNRIIYNSQYVKKQAQLDARDNIPSTDQISLPHAEKEFGKVGEMEANRLARKTVGTLGKLVPRLETSRFKKEESQKRRDRAEGNLEKSSEKLQQVTEANVQHLVAPGLDRPGYFSIIGMLVATDLSLNSLIFYLFGEPQVTTLVMSCGMVGSVALLTHFLGSALRSNPWSESIFSPESILMVLEIIGLLSLSGGLSYMRAKYFALSTVAAYIGLHIPTLVMAAIFLTINIGIILAMVVASFYYHNPERRRAHLEVKLAKKRVRADSKEYAKEKRNVRKYNEESAWREAKVISFVEVKRLQAEGHRIEVEWEEEYYRKFWLRYSKSHVEPFCFTNGYVNVEMPEIFSRSNGNSNQKP